MSFRATVEGAKSPGKWGAGLLLVISAISFSKLAIAQGSGDYPLKVIAITDEPGAPIPGGVFKAFSAPILSETGAVCFAGYGEDQSESSGIWTNFTGELLPVMINGDTVANVTGATVTVTRGSSTQAVGRVAINKSGDVAFSAEADPGNSAVCVSMDREGIRLRASESASFPGDTTFENLFSVFPLLDDNGSVVFENTSSGVTEMWRVDAKGDFRLVARSDDPAPGFPGQFFTGIGVRFLNSAGTLAMYWAALDPAAQPQDFVTGIWTESDGKLQFKVGSGSQLPGIPSNADSEITDLFWINDLGAVAFPAGWEAEGPMGSSMSGAGLYVVEPDGAIRQVISYTPDSNFAVQSAAVLNNGAVFYQIVNFPDLTTEFRRSGVTIVASGDPAPDATATQTFAGLFEEWTVNNRGQFAVEGILEGDVDFTNDRGIYATDSEGNLVKVIRTGEDIEAAPGDFRSVTDIFFPRPIPGSGQIFSDNGLLTFAVELDNSARAIVVAGREINSQDLVVNSTDNNDDGSCDDNHCSLCEAIQAANEREGPDRILFAIPESAAPYVIRPISPLPTITEEVEIDGTSQKGYQGEPIVVLDGATAGTLDTFQGGLTLGKGSRFCNISGLVIHNFAGHGIHIDEGAHHTIRNCYIGTTPNGMSASANLANGINVFDSHSNVIGGTKLADRNIISGNTNGIGIAGTGSYENLVVGNFIGVNKDGTSAVANTFDGIRISLGANDNTIGSSANGGSNLIAGNGTTASDMGGNGIVLSGTGTAINKIIANSIGILEHPNRLIGNVRNGILIEDEASENEIRGNQIILNGGDGVTLQSGRGNSVRLNSITANGEGPGDLPIDLVGDDGPDLNDIGDADTGPNDLLNYPELSSANIFLSSDESGYDPFVNLRGELVVPVSKEYTLDVYVTLFGCRNLGGYLGTARIPVGTQVPFEFEVKIPGTAPPGSEFTIQATLTDPDGNTSEVGCVNVSEIRSDFERAKLIFDAASRWKGETVKAPLDEQGLLGVISVWSRIMPAQ